MSGDKGSCELTRGRGDCRDPGVGDRERRRASASSEGVTNVGEFGDWRSLTGLGSGIGCWMSNSSCTVGGVDRCKESELEEADSIALVPGNCRFLVGSS